MLFFRHQALMRFSLTFCSVLLTSGFQLPSLSPVYLPPPHLLALVFVLPQVVLIKSTRHDHFCKWYREVWEVTERRYCNIETLLTATDLYFRFTFS